MSRRPPSQRDPAFANSRAAKVVSQLVPGRHRTTNAAPLPFKATTKARGLVPQPPAPAGGDSDHPGTGTDSTQVGGSAHAGGSDSTVVGVSATDNDEDHVTAVGEGANAQVGARHAVAIGYQAECDDHDSVAIGYTAITNAQAVAIGSQAGTGSDGATAVGRSSHGGGADSVALGRHARSEGDSSIAVGKDSYSFSDNGIAIGLTAAVHGDRGIVIGNNHNNTNADTAVLVSDSLEVLASSSGGAQTSIVLTDSAGVRWRIGVDTSGNPIGLGAA